MPFDWYDYYTLADILKNNKIESSLRSAISRAYYSVFGKAKFKLKLNGIVVPKKNTHKFVWDEFRNSSDKIWKKIGIDGDRMRSNRNMADYDDLYMNIEKDTEDIMLTAKKIHEELAKI